MKNKIKQKMGELKMDENLQNMLVITIGLLVIDSMKPIIKEAIKREKKLMENWKKC